MQELREDQYPLFFLVTYQVDTISEVGNVAKSTTRKLFLSVEDFTAAFALATKFKKDFDGESSQETILSIKDTPIVAFLEDSIVDQFIIARNNEDLALEHQPN